MEDITIRELPIEKYHELENILEQQQLYHYHLNGPYSDRFLEINAEKFKCYMEKKPAFITYIAEVNYQIIGFTSANINHHKEAFIEDLFVTENFRKQQIGHKLFRSVLTWLEKQNVKSIELHVSTGNEKVIPFYENFGFKLTGYSLEKR
ncbi:MAG: GNAT family N-acetyltransferase [Clostridia bacterium]|nr:GNAT family N-acetyltransferase [Clostridia bacterium]